MHKRPGFSEADLAPMFSALCRRSVTLVSFGFASSTIFRTAVSGACRPSITHRRVMIPDAMSPPRTLEKGALQLIEPCKLKSEPTLDAPRP
jgi:hypothetical protein